MPDNKPYLTRSESAQHLSEAGYPIRPKTLAKLASIGGGPVFRKFGHRVLYDSKDLLEWAEKRAGPLRESTSALINQAAA
jgi:hypothetical protein